ncbi:hypothetical protein G6M04_23315 [Agrobacterium rhizogenes]|uniref:hypothetical protein n=1 Tax=Rhizobium rhizogenes TaxID=359 RepID=UPI0015739CD0|nr:hypothetical protein [Rhizobium rhizogenes]NTG50327.1 hypothetical protein [Rhizobium rhizogenes]
MAFFRRPLAIGAMLYYLRIITCIDSLPGRPFEAEPVSAVQGNSEGAPQSWVERPLLFEHGASPSCVQGSLRNADL